MDEDDALELLKYVVHLYLIAFQELTASRNIKEKIPYAEVTALSAVCRLLMFEHSARYNYLSAKFVVGATRLQFDLRHGGY